MIGFLQNIEKAALANEYFRKVLFTGQHAQLVVMSLKPSEEIGMEVHQIVDQFIRIEAGEGRVIMNTQEQPIIAGDAFVIPAGVQHNVINTSTDKSLKLYTIYSPPHHKRGTIHQTKLQAEADKEDYL